MDALKLSNDIRYKLGILNSENNYIDENSLLFRNPLIKKILHSSYGNRNYRLNEAYSSFLIKSGKFDILHPTYYDPYFLKFLKKPFVLTVHDMTHEKLPEYFWPKDSLTHDKRICVQKANHLIAISETTKQDMIELYGLKPESIQVIHHGIDLQSPFLLKDVNNLPANYILFVGDRGGYKNFYMLVDAFHYIHKKYPELQLFLVGGGPLTIAEVEYLSRLSLNERIVHRHVDDEELNCVYSKAVAFIYPSLYEGFGLPVLESFRAKCPTLLSNIPSFKEVAGDAAFYFEVDQVDSLIFMLEKILDDEIYRGSLVDKGFSRLKLFDLQYSLQQTCDVYRSQI